MPKAAPPITCVSIIICDDVFHDKASNKMALWGTFNNIHAASLPVVHPRMSLFATITNGRGVRDVSICITNARTNDPIVELAGPIRFDNPLEVFDLNISLLGITFHEFGKYWVEVKDAGKILAQRPFSVLRAPGAKRKGKKNASQ